MRASCREVAGRGSAHLVPGVQLHLVDSWLHCRRFHQLLVVGDAKVADANGVDEALQRQEEEERKDGRKGRKEELKKACVHQVWAAASHSVAKGTHERLHARGECRVARWCRAGRTMRGATAGRRQGAARLAVCTHAAQRAHQAWAAGWLGRGGGRRHLFVRLLQRPPRARALCGVKGRVQQEEVHIWRIEVCQALPATQCRAAQYSTAGGSLVRAGSRCMARSPSAGPAWRRQLAATSDRLQLPCMQSPLVVKWLLPLHARPCCAFQAHLMPACAASYPQ